MAFLRSQYLEMKVEAGGGWITIGHTFQGQVVSFYKGVHSGDLEHNILSGVCRGNKETSEKLRALTIISPKVQPRTWQLYSQTGSQTMPLITLKIPSEKGFQHFSTFFGINVRRMTHLCHHQRYGKCWE